MNWLDSKTIKYVFLTWLGGTLLQLVPMLQAKQIDWWALGTQAVASLAAIIIRIAQPDVEAPKALNALSFGLLNRSNATLLKP